MNLTNDISLSTLIISTVASGTIAGAAWVLKAALSGSVKILISYIKSLLTKLETTSEKVLLLDSKMGDLTHAIGDVHKLRQDMNAFYSRLKTLEDDFKRHKEQEH